jgi:6-phosphogluconolactonase
LLSELTGTVTTLALDSVPVLPPDSKLVPGMPRGAVGTPGAFGRQIFTSPRMAAFFMPASAQRAPLRRFALTAQPESSAISAACRRRSSRRGFNIDPTGRFIVVSGEKSDMLGVYSIDGESGTLNAIGRYPTGKGANWVEIVSFD